MQQEVGPGWATLPWGHWSWPKGLLALPSTVLGICIQSISFILAVSCTEGLSRACRPQGGWNSQPVTMATGRDIQLWDVLPSLLRSILKLHGWAGWRGLHALTQVGKGQVPLMLASTSSPHIF